MRLFDKKYYLFTLIILFVISCKSPLEIVTPRTKIPIKGSNSLSLSSATFYENNVEKQFLLNDNYLVEIDTTKSPIIVWFETNFVYSDNNSVLTQSLSKFHISIDSISIYIDSLVLNRNLYAFTNTYNHSFWSRYHLIRGFNTTSSDTSVYSNDTNYSEIELIFTPKDKSLTAHLSSRLYDSKIWLEEHDTTITDTTFYKSGDSTWFVVNPNKIKQIIEEKRQKDSVLLESHLIFKYE